MQRFIFLCFLFGTLLQKMHAQQAGLGSWNILNMKYTCNSHWSVFGEAQLRSLLFYNHFHYHEYKFGVQYRLHKQAALTLAGGSYQTYAEGGNFIVPKNNDEFRIWPQIQSSQSFGRLKLEQRYRMEFRFTSNGYRNRFRYRFGLIFPFGKELNDSRPLQFSFHNEIFFTDREPYFERNRVSCGLGWKLNDLTMLQVGYLHQFDYRINDEIGRDFLQVGFYYDLKRSK